MKKNIETIVLKAVLISNLFFTGCGSLLTYKVPPIKDKNAIKTLDKAGDKYLVEGDYYDAASSFREAKNLKKLEMTLYMLVTYTTCPQDTINENYEFLRKNKYKIRPPEAVRKNLIEQGILKK